MVAQGNVEVEVELTCHKISFGGCIKRKLRKSDTLEKSKETWTWATRAQGEVEHMKGCGKLA